MSGVGEFKSNMAPSASVGASNSITQHKTIEKQVVGVSFSEKLAQFGGALAAQLGNGVATVSSAIGFAAGRSAGMGLSGLGQQLAAFGTTNPASISTQVHGMSNSVGGTGGPAVATGAGMQGQPSFGAGTSGGQGLGMIQGKQAAFGVGAVGLDSAGLAAGGGGGMSVGGASMGGGLGGGAIGAAAGGGGQDQLLNATKQMQETQMSFNLQYLQLQSQMQHENRSYTAISNIMKTKHDTVKNSISNVR